MIILGISCFYHDSSACILKDGKIVAAAQEERFTRKKHDNGFPFKSIKFCLDYLGIAANEVDIVAFYEKPVVKFERILSQHVKSYPKGSMVFAKSIGSWFTEKLQIKKLLEKEFSYHNNVVYVPHHMSHAASSYLLSGFKESVVVTIDGVGEWATTTVGYGENGKLRIDKEIHFPHSLGLLYSAMTSYLGFKVNNDEYKVMGLASYGNPRPYKKHIDSLIKTFSDGSFSLNMKYFDYEWSDRMISKKIEKLFGYPKRIPESEIEKHHEDIAAALQQKLEEAVFGILNASYKKYKTKNLCLAGGVALNSVMNGKIIKKTKFNNIYVPPDPGDGGGAMGAALYVYNQVSSKPYKPDRVFSPYLGPGFTNFEIEKVLKKHKLKYKLYSREKLISKTVEFIRQKKVIGWFQGRMEWGPRALGSRSILADASDSEMKTILNVKVKKRETFRPFAPVIIEKYVKSYFYNYTPAIKALGKYMLVVLPFRKKGKKDVPATVHVDGSGRLQSLERSDNPLYFDLIKAYQEKTKIPIIINTSFNIRGEPIVCTPEDAVNCFLNTQIDSLVIGNYITEK